MVVSFLVSETGRFFPAPALVASCVPAYGCAMRCSGVRMWQSVSCVALCVPSRCGLCSVPHCPCLFPLLPCRRFFLFSPVSNPGKYNSHCQSECVWPQTLLLVAAATVTVATLAGLPPPLDWR